MPLYENLPADWNTTKIRYVFSKFDYYAAIDEERFAVPTSGAYNSLYPNPVSVRLALLRKSAAAAAIRRRGGASSTTKSRSQKPSSSPSPLTPSSTEPMFPTAKAVPGKPGYVFSPFDASGRYIDVSGYPSGSRAKDPWTDKIFIVP